MFRNLGDLFDPSADPEQIALIGLDAALRAREFSYRHIDAIANGVARALLSRGYTSGDRIAVLAANSPRYVAVVLGIMRAGMVAVPVNFKFPAALIRYVLQDSGARLVFHDADRRVPEGLLALPSVELDDATGGELDRFIQPGSFSSVQTAGGLAAMMLYTSGSTGKPKGVLLSHDGQLWIVQARRAMAALTKERPLIAAPFYHMNAMALVLLTLASRATTVLLPQFTARTYLEAIERYHCTWLTAVPPMIAMMLREKPRVTQTDLSSVKVIRLGSAPVSASLLAQIDRMLPNARVINVYGTTESGPVVFGPHPMGLPTPPMSFGCAHPMVNLRLRQGAQDDAHQGVLEIKSPGLMLGYHRRPDLGSPFTDDGYYATGDVFRRDDDGFYYFVGRRDDMFVSGGENIFPGEVEKMLEQHPAVQQACVVPVEDDVKGTKPVAYVTLRAGASVDEQALKTFALENAPPYQHPRRIWFVEAFSLASTNKIDRNALRLNAAARVAAES